MRRKKLNKPKKSVLQSALREVFGNPPSKSLAARHKGSKAKQRKQLIAIGFSKARRGGK